MYDLIVKFFRFLFPIVKQAVVQAAADELSQVAYPNRRRMDVGYGPRSYTRYDRRPRPQRVGENPFTRDEPTETGEFHDVLMVAFDLRGRSAEDVHKWLHAQMPTCDSYPRDITLDSWWVANDERFDGSDCDSAVFVSMGNQDAARGLLRERGLVN